MADVEIESSQRYHPVGVSTTTDEPSLSLLNRWKWWFLVVINIVLLLMGQSGSVLLGRFYFDQGGESIWMATLVQTVAFPILFFPLFFPHPKTLSDTTMHTSMNTLIIVYFILGILSAVDNLMYTIGLLYLPVSTYSLICASQLAFNAIFSFLINAQKITLLLLNSVILLTLSASLIAIHTDSDTSEDKTVNVVNTKNKHIVGVLCTIGASAGYALLLCLMQLSFDKVLKKETFSVVLEMQIWTSFVASCFCMVGLFVSGEGQGLKDEMRRFNAGKVVYILTLVGTALAWQINSVGVVGLIYMVSSLFSNVMSMLSLPFVPVAAVLLYHEKMDGFKVVAMLLAILGFGSYIYQNYLDETKFNATSTPPICTPETSRSEYYLELEPPLVG